MDIAQLALRFSESELDVARHGLGGFLFRHLKEGERNPFEKNYLQTWYLNELYLREYNFLREKALSEGVMCEGIKGVYLVDAVYGDAGQRKMSDVDVLTDSEFHLVRILENSGYKKIDKTEYKSTFSRIIEGNEVAIEVHSRLYSDSSITPETENKQLTIKEHFYYLVYHLGYQHTYIRFNWFLDLHVFLNKFNLNVNEILKMARKRGHEKSFLISFYFYNQFFGTQLPSLKPFFSDLYDFDFFLEPQKNWMSYQLLKHQTKENLLEAFKYDLNWLWNKL